MRTSRPLATLMLAAVLAIGAAPAVVRADDPATGATTYITYEAFPSPAQQPGEEDEIPKPLVKSLGNTKPSTPRAQRKSRGWGQVRFTKDMTKALIDFEIKGVDPADIIMFHIHCGPPGLLGPIIVDFGKKLGDLPTAFAKGKISVEITNDDLTWASMFPPKGLPKGTVMPPETCPVEAGWPLTTKTIVGMEYLARRGLLYFNLHTKQHTYYGEVRGQLYLKQ
ncbi:MAG TPA: CHRD domain-containing protein [Kofleriaceae bacterium]|nr:CHRD domain-containing protein [Kofleriaceae bacterium]